MNALGEAIRTLMSRRGLTGAQLGEEIGLSATSVSRIIQGHAKPKQVTLSRLMKRLCVTPEDEQLILRAFTGVSVPAIEEPVSDDPKNALAERERIERWLEARTQAITFKDAVARELEKAGISYRRDVCDGIASADFLIERDDKRIAIECKFNVSRDFDKTVGIARLLQDLLRCEQVIVVVPFVGEFARAAKQCAPSIQVLSISDTIELIMKMAGHSAKGVK
jgi:transcriptional regulator with XRE-family HTH domain